MSVRTYGVRVGVRVNDPAALEAVVPLLPPGWTASPTRVVDELFSVYSPPAHGPSRIRRFHLLYRGGERLARTLDRGELLDSLEGHLKLCVAERATGRVFLHAGVVGWNGGAILIPGRSHSGKSRLVEAFLRRGATYYSDEYAVLDASARVHPYPVPLSLRDESGRPRRVPPESLGGELARDAVPVTRVVLTRYDPGAVWRPRRLTPGRALLGLLDHAIPARRRPADVIALLRRIVASAPVVKSARGEAELAVAQLLGS